MKKSALPLLLCLAGCALLHPPPEPTLAEREAKEHLRWYGMTAEERRAAIDAQPEPARSVIRKGEIRIGFTKEQVGLAWGRTPRVHRSVGSWGVREQWVYGDVYLYFEDGKLTSWQD